jgi:hypothetical protein
MARRQELHALNRVFVQDPTHLLAASLAPRDDIVCPAVLASAVAAADHAVRHAPTEMQLLEVPCPRAYRTQPRVRRLACYVAGYDLTLLQDAGLVDGRNGAAVAAWLLRHAGTMFLVSGAWYDIDGALHTMAYQSVQRIEQPSLDWMAARGYYAIASGLLLAMGLEQAGRWEADAVLYALDRLYATAHMKELFYVAPMTAKWRDLFDNIRYPDMCQVADVPHLYALQCRSDARIARFLFSHIGEAADPLVLRLTPHQCTLTSPHAAAFPLGRTEAWLLDDRAWPSAELRDLAGIAFASDWPGFVRTLCTNGRAWARWRADADWRQHVLRSADAARFSLLPPIFFVYNTGMEQAAPVPKYRLEALWRDVVGDEVGLARWCRHYLARMMLKEEAHHMEGFATLVKIAPAPPLAFLEMVRVRMAMGFGAWLFEEVVTNVAHAAPPAFAAHMEASRWGHGWSEGQLRLSYSPWSLLRYLSQYHATLRAFLEGLQTSAAQKLLALQALPAPVGQCMAEHLRGNRHLLY